MTYHHLIFLLAVAGGCTTSHGGPVSDEDAGPAPVDAGASEPTAPPAGPMEQVVAADHQSCARDGSGNVYCWGGWPSEVDSEQSREIRAPRRVDGIRGATDLAVAPGYACAATETDVLCWGRTPFTPSGETTPWSAPIALAGANGASGLMAIAPRVCAIVGEDRHVRCWGAMTSFESCPGGSVALPATIDPIDVAGLEGVTRIRAAGGVTCGVETGSGATCVRYLVRDGGAPSAGEGWPDGMRSLSSRDAVDLLVRHSEACFATGLALCLIDADGGAECEAGELPEALGLAGDGSRVERLVADRLGSHLCYLTDSGTLDCIGGDDDGPTRLGESLQDVAVGRAHACSLDPRGTVRCWGSNEHGALGIGAEAFVEEPHTVSGVADAVQIAAGQRHTCALEADGTVTCWGTNVAGQRGFERETPLPGVPFSLSPAEVTVAPRAVSLEVDPDRVFADGHRSCVAHDGGLTCWGADYQSSWSLDGPTLLTGVPSGLRSVAVGDRSESCGVAETGEVYCWGWGYFGTRVGVERVALPGPARTVVGRITDRTCALLETGDAYCWGSSVPDSLVGEGEPLSPQRAEHIAHARSLTDRCFVSDGGEWICTRGPVVEEAGEPERLLTGVTRADGPCAVKEGRVLCLRSFGERRSAPATWREDGTAELYEVPGLDDATSVATGDEHACALRSSGGIVCWGWAAGGRLGDGSRTVYLDPQPLAP